ncbi:MAG: two-component regulator propeller domain-containing protein [Cyclonatronaceae bacterium]
MASHAIGQKEGLHLKHLMINEGISNNNVTTILQDGQGLMWIGTEDGLNRYNGYGFLVFRYIPDENSVSDSFVTTLLEHGDSLIYIGTDNGGVSIRDRKNESFIQLGDELFRQNQVHISSITKDSEGLIWIGTRNQGIYRHDPQTGSGQWFQSEPDDPNTVSSNRIRSIHQDTHGRMWVGTLGGLNRYDPNEGTFQRFYARTGQRTDQIASNDINDIVGDKEGNLWIATSGGITFYSIREDRMFSLFPDSHPGGVLPEPHVNTLIVDRDGMVWAGGENSLLRIDTEFVSADGIPRISNFSEQLSFSSVRYLYEDLNGLIWIGTAGSGLYIHNPNQRVEHYYYDSRDPFSVSENRIRSFHEDSAGNIWVGTDGGGLNLFEQSQGLFHIYRHSPYDSESISGNTITAIQEDKNGYIWAGTYGSGLTVFRRPVTIPPDRLENVRRYSKLRAEPQSLSDNIVHSIFLDSRGWIWVGTENGLNRYVAETGHFEHYIHSESAAGMRPENRIQSNAIVEDHHGRLWIGTWGGLFRMAFDEETHLFEVVRQNRLGDMRITGLLAAGGHKLWIATYGDGLKMLDMDDPETPPMSYRERDGLSNNHVYAVTADDEGMIWLSTNNGLSRFDPASQSFRNYFRNDGLQSNQFYWGAGARTRDGRLLFGGIRGFNIISPPDLEHIPEHRKLVLTDLLVNSESVYSTKNHYQILQNLKENRSLVFDYKQNIISFEFAVLDYFAPEKYSYEYMLEGSDESWFSGGNRRYVTYSGLRPGDYTFMIRASAGEGNWLYFDEPLQFTIKHPFWLTLWFLIPFVLMVAAALVYIVRARMRSLLMLERLRYKISADLHDNIGSSLTEIAITSEVIAHTNPQLAGEVRRNLNIISEKSRSVIDSMSDTIWLVNPKRDTVHDLMLRLQDQYLDLLSQYNMTLTIHSDMELKKLHIAMDYRQNLYLIFKEAIHNAIRHSQCTEISLTARFHDRKLVILLEDNGLGFSQSSVFGNGIDNMKYRAGLLGGDLAIDTASGNGTRICYTGRIRNKLSFI